jgi:hypothetical protein
MIWEKGAMVFRHKAKSNKTGAGRQGIEAQTYKVLKTL